MIKLTYRHIYKTNMRDFRMIQLRLKKVVQQYSNNSSDHFQNSYLIHDIQDYNDSSCET